MQCPKACEKLKRRLASQGLNFFYTSLLPFQGIAKAVKCERDRMQRIELKWKKWRVVLRLFILLCCLLHFCQSFFFLVTGNVIHCGLKAAADDNL